MESQRAEGGRYDCRDRAALLGHPGDRCVLPLYKLAVGNIVRGGKAGNCWEVRGRVTMMERWRGGEDGARVKREEVSTGRRPRSVLNVS